MSAATATASAAEKPVQQEKAAPPKKPDEEEYKKALAAKQKEHDAVKAKLAEVRAKLDSTKPGGRDPRQQELRDQLNQIKSQVATKKAASQKLQDQIKTLQDNINNRGKELTSKQKAMPYRTVADLERAIANLDSQVSSGRMKIVDEKKALQEISTLNKQKKNFAVFEEQQKAIDADKAKLKELKDKKQDPELVELNKKFDELQKELNTLRDAQQEASKNVNSLRDERTKLQQEQNEKWDELKALKDNYYQGIREYREYSQKARKAREERYQKQRQEEELARKKKYAAEKLEEASSPAFQSEIIACETLIGYFDPSSAEAARKAKQSSAPSALAATAQRTVDDSQLKGKKLVKEEEEYFVGNPKKKGKKGRKGGAAAPAEEKTEEPAGKFLLNLGLIEQLSAIGVSTPNSQADVPQTLEELRKKLQWYKDNQDRVTQENIAKAKKELEKYENEGEEPKAAIPEAEKAEGKPAAEEEEEKKEEEAPAAEEKAE